MTVCKECGSEVKVDKDDTTFVICMKCHSAFKRHNYNGDTYTFPDTLLVETCEGCGSNITLMTSISTEGEFLVKRCLNCGEYPLVEMLRIG